jgi:hypothetical protein
MGWHTVNIYLSNKMSLIILLLTLMKTSAVALAASSPVGPPAQQHPSLLGCLVSRLAVVLPASHLSRMPELVLYELRTRLVPLYFVLKTWVFTTYTIPSRSTTRRRQVDNLKFDFKSWLDKGSG